MRIILASQSPRRQELLRKAGYKLEVCPAHFEEIGNIVNNAKKVVNINAKGKCMEIVRQMGDEIPVLGADTVVVLDGEIIGKPKDAADAKVTLKRLSGRKHDVLTGIVIAYRGEILSKVSKTEMYFKKLTDEQIDRYVATGKPLDKAGSYGIQDDDGFMIDHFVGSYDNVIGLDVMAVDNMLKELKAGQND